MSRDSHAQLPNSSSFWCWETASVHLLTIRGDWPRRYQQIGYHQEHLCQSSYQCLGPQGMANTGNMGKRLRSGNNSKWRCWVPNQRDKEVKKSARNDKRSYIEGLAAEAESAAARREMSTVYKITKRLCGNYTTHSAPVKGKEHEQADRWVEYFCEVLSRPDEPTDPKFSVESFLEESRQLSIRSWDKNKLDSGSE